MKDGCDPITSAKLALQLGATQLGHAQLGGPQAGGAQPCGARLDVWVAAAACGENFPAGAGGHLRPKTKKGTFFYKKRADLALSQ